MTARSSFEHAAEPAPAEPVESWILGGMYLARTQGLVFVGTGIWPIIDIQSFQKVTGPKVDLWLVKTVGLLITVIGAIVLRAGIRKTPTTETALLAAGSAAALATIDVVYVTRGRISPIYLLDAVMELGFVAGWGWWLQRRRQSLQQAEQTASTPDGSATAESDGGMPSA